MPFVVQFLRINVCRSLFFKVLNSITDYEILRVPVHVYNTSTSLELIQNCVDKGMSMMQQWRETIGLWHLLDKTMWCRRSNTDWLEIEDTSFDRLQFL